MTVCSSQSGALGTWGWFSPAARTLSESPGRIAAPGPGRRALFRLQLSERSRCVRQMGVVVAQGCR